MSLQIRKLSHALGAEISGLDISEPLADKDRDDIQAAFGSYGGLLLFRGQPLTRAQHKAFAQLFGEVDANESVIKRDKDYPEILVNRLEPGTKTFMTPWHSDQSYTLIPSAATTLRSIEIPDVGGDTMFANLYLAFETLSDGMKKLIDGLHGVHIAGKQNNRARRIDNSTPEREAETARQLERGVAQPLVRVHPKTGRKALFVNERVVQIVGLSKEESQPLIRFLVAHASRPQFVYRHRWQKHDFLIWDNRCLMHIALGDYDKAQVRHLERATIKGTPSGYVYDAPLH